MIILMAGLPGTGKTTLARELAHRTQGRVLGKDEIRHAIFAPQEIDYSSGQDDFCLHLMLEIAGHLLSQKPARLIFLDGRPFSRRYQVENVLNVAASLGQPWKIFECISSDETVRHRLEAAFEGGTHPAGNRDYRLYLEVKARFELISQPKTVLDTDQSLESCVRVGLAALSWPR